MQLMGISAPQRTSVPVCDPSSDKRAAWIKGQRADALPSSTQVSLKKENHISEFKMNWEPLRTLQCAQTVPLLPTSWAWYKHEMLIKRGTETRFLEIYSYLLYFDPNDMKQEKNNFYVVHLYEILHKGFCGYFKNVLKCCLKPHKTMWRTSRQN